MMTTENRRHKVKNGNAVNPDQHACEPGAGFFEIHVKGQLDSRWSEWLENMEVKLLEDGEMILSGPIEDQAALMGVLNKLSHLNLTLLAVNQARRKNKRRKNG
jgi:hypothetical protein